MATQKRRIFELRWDRRQLPPTWVLIDREDRRLVVEVFHMSGLPMAKKDAIRRAAQLCRYYREVGGRPTQLLIYTRAGRITRGGDGERSYGADSRRRPG